MNAFHSKQVLHPIKTHCHVFDKYFYKPLREILWKFISSLIAVPTLIYIPRPAASGLQVAQYCKQGIVVVLFIILIRV